jgi:hypothetical protein
MWSEYFPNLSVIEWFRQPKPTSRRMGGLWKIGDEKKVRVGEDPWLGAGNSFRLSLPLILSLRNKNIISLHDTCIGFPSLKVEQARKM